MYWEDDEDKDPDPIELYIELAIMMGICSIGWLAIVLFFCL